MAKFTKSNGKGKKPSVYETDNAVERVRLLSTGWSEEKPAKKAASSSSGSSRS